MTRRLRKFVGLPVGSKLLLVEALLTLLAYRLALWVLPARVVLRAAAQGGADPVVRAANLCSPQLADTPRDREGAVGAPSYSANPADCDPVAGETPAPRKPAVLSGADVTTAPTRIAWAVPAAAQAVPRCTCLVRALAGRRMLWRRGIRSELRIGVAKSPDFQAHAWLECDGTIVIGASGTHFTPLAAI